MKRVLIALALLGAPAHAQPWMTGTWFGTGQPGEGAAMYIDRMLADGQWRGEYRTCRAGKSRDLVQTGRWQLQGDKLVLKVEMVGGQPQPRTDFYRMLSHDAHGQKYLSLPSNFPYTPQRVADNFPMPSCELIG